MYATLIVENTYYCESGGCKICTIIITLVVDALGLGNSCTRIEENDQADTSNIIQRRQNTGVYLKVDSSFFLRLLYCFYAGPGPCS